MYVYMNIYACEYVVCERIWTCVYMDICVCHTNIICVTISVCMCVYVHEYVRCIESDCHMTTALSWAPAGPSSPRGSHHPRRRRPLPKGTMPWGGCGVLGWAHQPLQHGALSVHPDWLARTAYLATPTGYQNQSWHLHIGSPRHLGRPDRPRPALLCSVHSPAWPNLPLSQTLLLHIWKLPFYFKCVPFHWYINNI